MEVYLGDSGDGGQRPIITASIEPIRFFLRGISCQNKGKFMFFHDGVFPPVSPNPYLFFPTVVGIKCEDSGRRPADIPSMVFRIPGCRHDMDAAAVPRVEWTPQHTPNMCPWAGLCHDPALAFGVANRFLNMFVGVLGHDFLRCLCVVLMAFIISWPEYS